MTCSYNEQIFGTSFKKSAAFVPPPQTKRKVAQQPPELSFGQREVITAASLVARSLGD